MTRYALRNSSGEWYRAGQHWRGGTDDVNKAKLYAKIGQARARRTSLATHKGGFVEIWKFECEPSLADDSDYVAKSARKRAARKERAEVKQAKWRLEAAEASYASAKAQLELARR